MKELFASAQYGMAGLLLFFIIFMGILTWVFWPGSKEKFQDHGEIPLKDGHDE